MINKIIFWMFVIILGFVNPLISVALIILYYLPGIIQNLCETCEENNSNEFTYEQTRTYKSEQPSHKINSFSDDTLEDMK